MALQHRGSDTGRRRSRRWLYGTFASLALAAAAFLCATYFAAPWLNRRFNRFFEDLIGATLNVPVEIESVQTSPFSRLTLTRLRSISAAEQGKIEFAASEISFYYDPVELLSGRLEKIVLAGPKMFLNLDANLQGIAQVPDLTLPAGSGEQKSLAPDAGGDYLPFSIAETVIQSGDVQLEIEGRTLQLSDLRLSVFELGRATGQSFQLRARAFGAEITAQGVVELTVEDGRLVPRYGLRGASVEIDGLELGRCITWWRGGAPSPAPTPDAPGDRDPRGSARDGPAPETLAAAVLRLLERSSGLMTLEGTLDGVWPERIQLKLTSTATRLATQYGPSLGVTAGEARVRVEVVALRRLEELSFDVEAGATGQLEAQASLTDEAVTVSAKGEYAREGDGRLRVQALEVDFRNSGRLDLAGEVAPLGAGTSPRVDLTINAFALDARRLLTLRLLPLPPEMPLAPAGNVDMRLRVGGPLDAPRVDGTVTLPVIFSTKVSGTAPDDASSFPFTVEGEFQGLEVDSRTLGGRLETVRLNASSLDLGRAVSLLPPDLRLDRHGVTVGGATFDAVLEGTDLEWSSSGLSGAVRASAAASGVELTSEDLWLEATGIHSQVSLQTRFGPTGGEFPFDFAADLKLSEFLVGDVHASLEGEKSRVRAQGTWTAGSEHVLDRLRIETLTLETPLSGRTRGEGRLWRSPGSPSIELELALHTTGVPTVRAFETFVREPLEDAAPVAESLRLDGDMVVDIEIKGPLRAPLTSGRWHLADGRFNVGNFELDGVQLDCPFGFGANGVEDSPAPGRRGRLRVRRIASAAFTLRDLDLRFLQHAEEYRLTEPVVVRLFGGTLDIRGLRFAPARDEGPVVEVEGRIRNLDLERLTRAYHWIPLEGRVDATFQPVRYDGTRIEWKGSVDVKAFRGRLRFMDFRIDDLFQSYASFELHRGVIEDVDLRELGNTFNFGLVSGVLRGSVEDLELVAGELTGFRLDVETVPVPGVRQFIDRRAVKSIRRTLGGALGDIEETLFSTFDYDRFGFTSELDDGTFRLRGKYVEGGHEYIMLARWYQFPRISIINSQPGEDYDWDLILANLREIYLGNDE